MPDPDVLEKYDELRKQVFKTLAAYRATIGQHPMGPEWAAFREELDALDLAV